MRIRIVCPSPPGSSSGNRITALRWAHILRHLGHHPRIAQGYDGEPCDLLIALHAQRSADAVFRFRGRYPDKPVVVALTGTDVYRDIRRYRKAQQVLDVATHLAVLQPLALQELAPHLRDKARVIYQSAQRTMVRTSPCDTTFDVCVLSHLRAVKDPLRAAHASRRLPPASRIRVVHAGAAIEDALAQKARAEEMRNPRYRWLGAIPPWKARHLMARSRLLVLSSRMEGGANVMSEALINKVPVLASRIPGSVGLLGPAYPGYFPVGSTAALTRLLLEAESNARFYHALKSWCSRLAPLFRPSRERAAWKALLKNVESPQGRRGAHRLPPHSPSPRVFAPA